jgi:hypothetical protein
MKFAADRPTPIPKRPPARSLNSPTASRSSKTAIELINGPFLFREKATPEEYKAGLDLAVGRGWLVLHESGTFVRFTPTGADLFA